MRLVHNFSSILQFWTAQFDSSNTLNNCSLSLFVLSMYSMTNTIYQACYKDTTLWKCYPSWCRRLTIKKTHFVLLWSSTGHLCEESNFVVQQLMHSCCLWSDLWCNVLVVALSCEVWKCNIKTYLISECFCKAFV